MTTRTTARRAGTEPAAAASPRATAMTNGRQADSAALSQKITHHEQQAIDLRLSSKNATRSMATRTFECFQE